MLKYIRTIMYLNPRYWLEKNAAQLLNINLESYCPVEILTLKTVPYR